MKRFALILFTVLPVAMLAQVNEMFYVPKKAVSQTDVEKILSAGEDEWGVADNGISRDVDEYNRRGSYSVQAGDVEAVLQGGENDYEYDYTAESDDYNYSTRIIRFHNPTTVVVSSPWYYDVYPSGYYYDYYDYHNGWYFDWNLGWRGAGWAISTGWHWPSYNWYCGGYHAHHHHHHGPVLYPSRSVRSHIPTVSLAGGSRGRRPSVAASGDRGERPQVNNGSNRGSLRKKSEGAGSSTYNRRSSSAVRRENSSSGTRNNRSSVGSSGSGTRNNRSSVGSSSSGTRNNRSSVGSSSGSSRSGSSRGGSSRSGTRR